ncbi:MAG: DUF4139 domain-containing protein [Planctomycetota bacterium]
MYRYFWLIAAVMLMLPFVAMAQETKESDDSGLALTVYNQNFAVVRDIRELDLKAGDNVVLFRNVAASIDGASLHFKSLTDPDGTVVLEQNYEYDLVSGEKLLQKYLDCSIRVLTKDGKVYDGTLLGFDRDQIILAKDPQKGPIEIVSRNDNVTAVVCSELPKGLLTQPTLMWKIAAKKEGKHKSKVTYITRNISWEADYTAAISNDETQLDLSGWVTIRNNSGKRYEDAKIKLVAGSLNIARDMDDGKWGRTGGGIAAKEFFEYYLYTMPRKSTIEDSSTKQMELLNIGEVKCDKIYRYNSTASRRGNPWDKQYGTGETGKVDVFISFVNSKDNNLAIPLPAGRIRAYKKDMDDGSLELIGEDRIGHTPKDEKIELKMGSAFDIVGERKQTDFSRFGSLLEESYEIKIRNHKKEKISVEVWERLYRSAHWEIKKSSIDYEKMDSNTIKFVVEVEPDKEAVVTYTVLSDLK